MNFPAASGNEYNPKKLTFSNSYCISISKKTIMKQKINHHDAAKEQFLTPIMDGKFQFSCHKGVSCFTDCCRDQRLVLTPFDVVRIKNRLKLSSKEFLDAYTEVDFDEEICLPMILLKMKDDDSRRCPFVSSKGCLIYQDRPGACRIYPLREAANTGFSFDDVKEHYFMVRDPYCKGFEEERIWSVREWLKDQEVDTYNDHNKYWVEVITGHSPTTHQGLTDKKLQMFYMASYNVDAFKEFVFSSSFLNFFVIEEETITRIKSDDIELLKFACRWLKFSLFGEPALKVKDEVIPTKK